MKSPFKSLNKPSVCLKVRERKLPVCFKVWERRLPACFFILCSLISIVPAALAQQKFIYQGREISKQYFDALNTARSAQPLMHSGNYAQAEAILKKAVEGAPDNPDILANYALVLVKMGRADDAVSVYEKVAILDPQSESCWVGWAGAYGAIGQLENSLRVCKEFLRKFPKSPLFAQMQNQAATIEKEIARLEKARSASGYDNAEDYFSEAIIGTPHRWNLSAPIPVYVADGKTVPKWKPSFTETLRRSFNDWSELSGGLVKFKFVENSKDAKIICFWTNDTVKLKNPAELGQTDTSWLVNGELTKATIKLLTVTPTNLTAPMSVDKVRQTTLHEIGHALGINGHSANPKDSMFFASIAVIDPKLTDRDIKTLHRLYKDAGEMPALPGSTPSGSNLPGSTPSGSNLPGSTPSGSNLPGSTPDVQ